MTAVAFLAILAPSLTAPGATESLASELHASPTEAPEHAAIPPEPEMSPSSGQQEISEGSSEATTPPLAEPPSPDPRAEALDESRQLQQTVISRPVEPAFVLNPDVQQFLDRFTGTRRDVVGVWMSRSPRYAGMIRETMRRQGLPEDLVWVAMIESGFNPLAVSRAGAKGLWQFMATTARRYGLRVDAWVDERLDPEKATIAAAAYLRDLYSLFGSWELAWAAYNAGEVTIARAIRVAGSSDFWALARTRHLRRETKDFVPQIHAARLIGRAPAHYGFEVPGAAPAAVETVAVPPKTDLRRLASGSGLALGALRALNPALVRGITPPGDRWALRVPAASRAMVLAALEPGRPAKPAVAVAGSPAPARASAGARIHVVRPRDTIGAIARRYGVSVGDVLRWNGLDPNDTIRPGDRLHVAASRPLGEPDGQGGFR